MITIRYHGWANNGKVEGLEATADFNTEDEAKAFAAQFPRYVKATVHTISGFKGEAYAHWFGVTVKVYLLADDVNKGVNETGLKRARKFFAVARTLPGVTFEYANILGNAVDVLAEGTI